MTSRYVLRALTFLAAVFAISAVFSMKGPLQDVHWDAPIYVSRAKEFAETPYLRKYMAEAPAIAEGLSRWKIGEDTAYWGFLRLGNTVLLGLVTSLMGANTASLLAGFLLYTALLAAALISSLVLVLRIAETLGNDPLQRPAMIAGALVSGGLYLASDIYRYLSGNQVSEVPAMLLLSCSALALVQAAKSRSIALAALSGVLGFFLYVVRVEAVWAYLSFLLLFAGALFWRQRERPWLRMALASGLTALLMYLLYAWLFWPIADPRLLLTFTAGVQEAPQNGLPAAKLLVAAGGALWVGLLLAIYLDRSSPVLWFALIWCFLLLLPTMDALLGKRQTETRMYSVVLAPLLIASSIGWASAFARAADGRIHRAIIPLAATMAALIIAVSQAESYQLLRQLPGGWRLQYVRAWLSPPSYERLSYPVRELQQVSRFAYSRRTLTVLVPEQGRLDEHLRIVRYLAPTDVQRKPEAGQQALEVQVVCKGELLRPDVSHVMFCSEPPLLRGRGDAAGDIEVLFLRERSDPAAGIATDDESIVLQTNSLELFARTVP